ncbi:MAG: hypothetical protein GWP10_13485 [Nitrospiraceae bacterium]|nr:hypothetical protein [Nitrospiraceae bacterium]
MEIDKILNKLDNDELSEFVDELQLPFNLSESSISHRVANEVFGNNYNITQLSSLAIPLARFLRNKLRLLSSSFVDVKKLSVVESSKSEEKNLNKIQS